MSSPEASDDDVLLEQLRAGEAAALEPLMERFASRVGVALVARDRRELTATLRRAVTEPGLLDAVRDRIAAVRQPEATRRIVETSLAGRPA